MRIKYWPTFLRPPHTCPHLQYCALLNWNNIQLRCGCAPVTVNWNFVVFSPCFVIFKNVEHRLLGVSPGSKLCATFVNITHQFKSAWCGCGYLALKYMPRYILITCKHKYDNVIEFICNHNVLYRIKIGLKLKYSDNHLNRTW